MMRMRWTYISALAISVCAVAATVLAFSGCAESAAVSSVIDPVAHAAEVSELAPGFRALVSEELIPPNSSETVTASGTEIFDRKHQRATLSLQMNEGEHASTVEAQYTDLNIYMHLPSSQDSPAAHGKPWIKFDLRGVSAALGVNFSALSGSGAASSNPSQLLSYLRATGAKAALIGSERIRGVPTTHYRATIDYDRYASQVAPAERAAARDSMAAIERLTGSHTQVVDVWVDKQNRVRREELDYRQCIPGVRGSTRIHLNVELVNFGIQAVPPLPSREEVADVTNYVVEKLKHVKIGCQ
jgi:hypothetical protein